VLLPFLEQQPLYNSINLLDTGFFGSGVNDTAARTTIASFLCPSDFAARFGTSYAGNTGVSFQKYGWNGLIARTRVGHGSLTDGASQTAAFAEIVRGEWAGRDPRRVVYQPPHSLYRDEDFDRFTEECRGLNTATSPIIYDMRGTSWIDCDFFSYALQSRESP